MHERDTHAEKISYVTHYSSETDSTSMVGIALLALVALFVVVIAASAVIIVKAKKETQKLNKFLQA